MTNELFPYVLFQVLLPHLENGQDFNPKISL